ncbi:MAG: hypothetical protein B7733_11635 [Myxococcales bacterium FL481]|nr:MAG: hypothetical protein B7733_12230 [Myxococcales bacterium FL481]TPV95129.1 MAG: hypothetical protein B7733_11635 [Myxococcales bacterium FL481]
MYGPLRLVSARPVWARATSWICACAGLAALASPERAAAAPPDKPRATAGETARTASIRPPRLDGTYLGGTVAAAGSLVRVDGLNTDNPFVGNNIEIQVGQTVYRWLALGFSLSSSGGVAPEQTNRMFGLRVDLTAVPMPRRNLSVRAGFGFGAGAVRNEGISGRFGYGGASFHGAVRYTFFPWADKKRPRRGGGLGLAPELGWIGQTPTETGGPMSNTIVLGLATMFYFGH